MTCRGDHATYDWDWKMSEANLNRKELPTLESLPKVCCPAPQAAEAAAGST